MTDQIAEQYGVPPRLLDATVKQGGGTGSAVEKEAAAIKLSNLYTQTGDWQQAVANYSVENFGNRWATATEEIVANSELAPPKEESSFFEAPIDTVLEKLGNIGKGAAFVFLGLMLIALAFLTFKPVQDAAKTAVTKGAM